MQPTQQGFVNPATEDMLQHVAERLRERGIEALIVNTGAEAREIVLERLPKGAEVHWSKSKTLQDAGIFEVVNDPAQYNGLRNRYMKMDRMTQGDEIRRLIAAPDYMLGSVNAVTEDGILVATSATAGQIGPYAAAAGKVILVVGSQKVVPNLDAALKRIEEYVAPWEDQQLRKAINMGSFIGKTLIIEREWVKDRIAVILVREPIGI